MNLNYWDNSGGGGGFDNLSFDSFKLSYSLIQNIKDGFNDRAAINDGSDRAITTHDLRLYDIDTNPDGKLTIGLAAVQSEVIAPVVTVPMAGNSTCNTSKNRCAVALTASPCNTVVAQGQR